MVSQEIEIISNNDLACSFRLKRKPFVLRNSNIGCCSDKWGAEYLAGVLGDKQVKLHVSEFKSLSFLTKNFIYRTLTFKEFLKRASEHEHSDDQYFLTKTESYYLRSVGDNVRKDVANIHSQFPAVASDIVFPKFIPEETIFSSVFRIASKGLTVWTHYDVMDNALIQVKGNKRAVLFPPSDTPYLYLNGDKSEVMDIDNPDLKKYPEFSRVTRYECCLMPGDVLFIPAFWHHNMKYLDFGIAVNVFWKELSPSLYDSKDTYGNKDLIPAQKAIGFLNKSVSALSELPPYYRDFYCLRMIAQLQEAMRQQDDR